eukprot:gene6768-7530_t
MDRFYKSVFQRFPDGIELAFAYGSGVFQQSNNNPAKDNMVDLFFVVKDPAMWHRVNTERHPDHYSFLSYFGPGTIANIQCNYGSHVYFNTLVKFEDRLIKYGVISVDDFLRDLIEWNTLYVSGRLHKPVLQLRNFNENPFKTSLQQNLTSAVNASRLLLPEKFTSEDLFLTIASLSYSGDFRMTFGEDKNKIRNIVMPNLESFKELYKGTIRRTRVTKLNHTSYAQDISTNERQTLLKMLPTALKHKLASFSGHKTDTDFSIISQELAEDRNKCSALLHKSVSSIVLKYSITQSLKGIATAGLGKSFIYSAAKLRKMAKSILK